VALRLQPRTAANKFPYAATYSATSCNGFDYGAGAPITVGTAANCVSDFGMAVGKVYDLSGNVKEWAATTLAATTPFRPTAFEMRGGAYNTLSFVDSSSARRRRSRPACSATRPRRRRPPTCSCPRSASAAATRARCPIN